MDQSVQRAAGIGRTILPDLGRQDQPDRRLHREYAAEEQVHQDDLREGFEQAQRGNDFERVAVGRAARARVEVDADHGRNGREEGCRTFRPNLEPRRNGRKTFRGSRHFRMSSFFKVEITGTIFFVNHWMHF